MFYLKLLIQIASIVFAAGNVESGCFGGDGKLSDKLDGFVHNLVSENGCTNVNGDGVGVEMGVIEIDSLMKNMCVSY